MLKYSAPEHQHFTVFAVPETIIFEISLPTAGLFSRAPRVRSGAPHFHARHAPEPLELAPGALHFSLCRGAPGLAAGQSASQTFRRPAFSHSSSPSSLQSPAFARSSSPSSLRSPAFLRSSSPSSIRSPPFFTLPRHHTYQNLGWVPPPPPRVIITQEPPKRPRGPSYLNRGKGNNHENGLKNTIYSHSN